LSGGPYLSVGLHFYYLGTKKTSFTNHIIATANAVVNPNADFLPILLQYFPFTALPTIFMTRFPTKPIQKYSLAQEKTCPEKYRKSLILASEKPFLLKSYLLYADNLIN